MWHFQVSHLATLSSVALEAALQGDLSQLRADVAALRARLKSQHEPGSCPGRFGIFAGGSSDAA
eukprot:12154090-Alexandrium_andersonii.AAC.1